MSVLGRRDQPLDPPPELLGARLGRGDPAGLQKRSAQVAHQRLARVRVAVEVAAALLMAHSET